MPHVNFHIGAPRIAASILKDAAKLKSVRKAKQVYILKPAEYQKNLRSIINASRNASDQSGDEAHDHQDFIEQLGAFEVMAASQHAMMGHPEVVFKQGLILPKAEDRLERLANYFTSCSLDFHLTIANQATYLPMLPTNYLTDGASEDFEAAVPSWAELVTRIRQACPDTRLLVWDFTRPELVALPFAMTMLNVDETLATQMKKPITTSLSENALVSKIVPRSALGKDVTDVLTAQFQDDLDRIEAMERTVLIRSERVPKDFHLKVA